VELWFDGDSVRGAPRGERAGGELAAFGAEGAPTEWRLELALDGVDAPATRPVWIAAAAEAGLEKLLFLGTLGELLRLGAERERDAWRARAELAEARATLFSASGFGRAHRAWLRAKRAAGRLPADFPAELVDPPRRPG
jgi:hypothetical protein